MVVVVTDILESCISFHIFITFFGGVFFTAELPCHCKKMNEIKKTGIMKNRKVLG